MDLSRIIDVILNVSLSDKVSFFALIVSVLSLYKSWESNKKADKISAPIIAGEYTRSSNYVLHIQDFSPGKNLRIDKVMIKHEDKLKYFEARYEENRLADQVPPVIELLLPEEIMFERFKIKVYNNYKTISHITPGFFPKNKWYKILIKESVVKSAITNLKKSNK